MVCYLSKSFVHVRLIIPLLYAYELVCCFCLLHVGGIIVFLYLINSTAAEQRFVVSLSAQDKHCSLISCIQSRRSDLWITEFP